MKNRLVALTSLLAIAFFASCDKEGEMDINFYDSDFRNGLWISTDQRDTLHFVDNSNLSVSGDFAGNGEFVYRIERNMLVLAIPDLSRETNHPILSADKSKVVLGNMIITNGFVNNSRTFLKED